MSPGAGAIAHGRYEVRAGGVVRMSYQKVEQSRTFGLTHTSHGELWPVLVLRDVDDTRQRYRHEASATVTGAKGTGHVVRTDVRLSGSLLELVDADACRADVAVHVRLTEGSKIVEDKRFTWSDVPCRAARDGDLVNLSIGGCERPRAVDANSCWTNTRLAPTLPSTPVKDVLDRAFSPMLAAHVDRPDVLFAIESHTVPWSAFWHRKPSSDGGADDAPGTR